jgi:hypothetical protein
VNDNIYLSDDAEITPSSDSKSTPLDVVLEFLKKAIVSNEKDLIIEIDDLCNHGHTSFDTMGSARFEILHYNKTRSDDKEQITFYGLAENGKFQTKPFTLIFNTVWADERFAHNDPKDQYFDSIIVNQYGPSNMLKDMTFNLTLQDSQEVLIGYCTGSLRFEIENQS